VFIDVRRFVGQTIGQLNDQIRLILQNVQTQGSFARINSRGREDGLHSDPLGPSGDRE
jgi:hypothetical protein